MPICESLSVPCVPRTGAVADLLSVQTDSRMSAITAESLESNKELLNTARAGLEDHLERMDESLSLHFTRSEADKVGAPEHGKVSTDLYPAIQT
jgi:hypothetical protein